MNQDRDKVVLSTPALGVLAIGSLGVYLLLQTEALIRSNENLIAQVRELHKVSESAVTAEAVLGDDQFPSKKCTDISQLVSALRAELTPLSERILAMETSVRERSATNPKPKAGGTANDTVREFPMPPLPSGLVGGPISPLPINGRQGASKESAQQFESAIRKNAAQVREQIAAETDPGNPDPAAIQRIMIQSQAEMAAELSSILPAEDYEAIFPPLLHPGTIPPGR